jgi:hypothetical protein
MVSSLSDYPAGPGQTSVRQMSVDCTLYRDELSNWQGQPSLDSHTPARRLVQLERCGVRPKETARRARANRP